MRTSLGFRQPTSFSSCRISKVAPARARCRNAITEAEMETAAAYFTEIKPRSIVTVVESETAPKSYITGWHLAAAKGVEKEPIAGRIIEVPNDLEQFVSRDARTQFTAYVPPGSIKRGEGLATTGGDGKTIPGAIW